MNFSEKRLKKKGFAATVIAACLISVIIGIMLLSGGASMPAISAGAQEDTATPYREYTALDVSADSGYKVLYGVTTARGLKANITVTGTVNADTFTLLPEEYTVSVDGRVLGSNDVIVPKADDIPTSVAVVVSSGSVSADFVVGVEEYEDSVTQIKKAELRSGNSITDDHTNYSIIKELIVTDGEDNELRCDLYTAELTYSGNSATITVYYVPDSSISKTITVNVTKASVIGAYLTVKSEYVQDGLHYYNSDGYDAFVKGASPEQIFGKLNIVAVYPNSHKTLKPTFNEQNQLSGVETGEDVSTTFTTSATDSSHVIDITVSGNYASITLAFYDQQIVKITVNQSEFEAILQEKYPIYPYTNLNPNEFKSAVTLISNLGAESAPNNGDLNFSGNLAPTAEIIKSGVASYSKEISVVYAANESVNAKVAVSNISYVEPTGLGDITGDIAAQYMHHTVDYSGLKATLYYVVGNRRNTVEVPLTDFCDANGSPDANFITTEIDNDSSKKFISKETAEVSVSFKYNLKNGNLIECDWPYVADRDTGLRILKDRVAIPEMDTSSLEFTEDAGKTFDISQLRYGNKEFNSAHDFDMTVSFVNDNGSDYDGENAPEYDPFTGKVTFTGGGVYYIKVSLGNDTVSQEEYEFYSDKVDSNVKLLESSVIYTITVNKGRLTLNLSDIAGKLYYGDDVNTAVTGTAGGKTYVLTNSETAAADGELAILYNLIFLPQSATYNPDDYTYESYKLEDQTFYNKTTKSINAGTYTVYAVTKGNNAYLPSKSKVGSGIKVTVNKKEITLGNSAALDYGRTVYKASDFITAQNFVTPDDADTVLNVTTADGRFLHAGSYKVTVAVNPAYTSNYTLAGNVASKNLTFVINPLTQSITASRSDSGDIYYGTTAPDLSASGTGYFKINANPKYYDSSNAEVDINGFATWAAGDYKAVFTTALDGDPLNSDEQAHNDYDLPTAEYTFTVKPAVVKKVGLSGFYGTYNGTVHSFTLEDFLNGSYANILNGNATTDVTDVLDVSVDSPATFGYGNGTVSVTDAGDYTVTVALKPNYVWDDESTADIVFNGTIAKAQLSDLTVGDGGTYDATEKTATVTVSGICGTDSAIEIDTITFTDANSQTSTVNKLDATGFKAKNAGEYTVAVKIINANYEWASGEATGITYTIKRAPVKVEWSDGTDKYYVYSDTAYPQFEYDEDGVNQQPTVKSAVYAGDDLGALVIEIYDNDKFTGKDYSGSQLSAGTYYERIIGYAGNNPNYILADVGEDGFEFVSIKFVIESQKLDKVVLTNGSDKVEVIYKGSAYKFSDYIKDYSKNYYINSSASRIDITVESVSGNNPDLTDVKTVSNAVADYVVKIRPAASYEWNDNSKTEYTFYFKIKQLPVDITYSDKSLTYNGSAQNPTATITNIKNGDDVSVTLSAAQTNAGNYTATANGLTGSRAFNYTLEGAGGDGTSCSYAILKSVLSLPSADFTQNGKYDGAKHTVTYSIPQNYNSLISGISVNAKGVDGINASITDGVSVEIVGNKIQLTYLHAGDYTVELTLGADIRKNYCFSAEQQSDFTIADASKYTYELPEIFTVDRKQIKAPEIGNMRALESQGSAVAPKFTSMTTDGINFTVSYGTYSDGVFSATTDGYDSKERGKVYYVKLTISGSAAAVAGEFSIYDYEWVNNDTDTLRLDLVTAQGGIYGSPLYAENDVSMRLCYVITKTQVGALFEFEGYEFGANGIDGDRSLLDSYEFGALVAGNSIGLTYKADPAYNGTLGFIEGANPTVTVEAYHGEAKAECVNGLPWDAGEYILHIKVSFGDESVYNDFERTATFTVSQRTVVAKWEGPASIAYNGAAQVPVAVVDNMPRKDSSDVTAAPTLIVTLADKTLPVNAKKYEVFVTGMDGNGVSNFVLGDNAADYGYDFEITPAEITVNTTDTSITYGSDLSFGDKYEIVSGTVYTDDAGVISVYVADASNNRITDSLNATVDGNYKLVPELVGDKAGNYNLTVGNEGVLTVTVRTLTVSVTKATSVYGSEPERIGRTVTNLPATVTDGDDLFTLGAGVTDHSPVSTDTVKYVITATVVNSNYTVVFADTYYYEITPADITVSASGYSGEYDGAEHAIFGSLAATVKNPTDNTVTCEYKKQGDTEWTAYTDQKVKNVTDAKYTLKVSAPNHNDKEIEFTVRITPKALTVSMSLTVYFGENDPLYYNGTDAYKSDLGDLTDGDIYTFGGLCGTDTAANIFNAGSSFTYGYASTAYTRGSDIGNYPLTVNVANLVAPNYTVSSLGGTLKVLSLPVYVSFDKTEYTSYYNNPNPEKPQVTVTVNQKSSYDGSKTVQAYHDNVADIVTVNNPALTGGSITTAIVGNYTVTVTAKANYTVVSDGNETASYRITRAVNQTDISGLFVSAPSAKDSVPDGYAWVYGDYSASHTSGYNASGAHKLNRVTLTYNNQVLSAALYRVGDDSPIATVTVAASGDVTAALSQLFESAHSKQAFNAGSYKLTLDMDESTNYQALAEDWYFKVDKKALTITPLDFGVVYGDSVVTQSPSGYVSAPYPYKAEGLVSNGGASDTLASVISVAFGSAYSAGYENGKVGSYAIGAGVNGGNFDYTEFTHSADNYIVTLKTGTLTVTARPITVKVMRKVNSYNFVTYDLSSNAYVTENAAELTYVLTAGSFAAGDGNSEIGTEYVFGNQDVFVLNSRAVINNVTSAVGKYAIYLTAGSKYYGNDNAPNYAITVIVDGDEASLIPEEEAAALTNKAATYEIIKAKLNVRIVGTFYRDENGDLIEYTTNDDSLYDGKEKLFKVDARLPGGVNPEFSPQYYLCENGYKTGEPLNYVPVNSGYYYVEYVVGDSNYEVGLQGLSYRINPRPLSVDYRISNSNGSYMSENGGYKFNGGDYSYTLTFNNLIGDEEVGYTTAVILTLNKSIALAKETFMTYTEQRDGDSYIFTARNSGKYAVSLKLADNGSFIASNYTVNGADTYGFTMNILLQTLTIQTQPITVMYGTAIDDGKFNPLYFINGVGTDSPNSATRQLLIDERDKGYLGFASGNKLYTTNYAQSTSKWGNKYNLAFNTSALSAYNFDVHTESTANAITVIKRDITVTVHGYKADGTGNALASCVYAGQSQNHNECLQDTLSTPANKVKFFTVNYGDGFVYPDDFNTDSRFADPVIASLNLRISSSARNADIIAMAPSSSADRYNVKFVNDNGEVLDGGLENHELLAYAILPKELKITLVNKEGTPVFNADNAITIPYGTAANENYFKICYSGWVSGEHTDTGTVNVTYRNVTVTGYDIGGYGAWTSRAGETFTVKPVFKNENGNYDIKVVNTVMTVGSLVLSAQSLPVTYTEDTDGSGNIIYHGGEFGAAHNVSLKFTYGASRTLPANAAGIVYTTEYYDGNVKLDGAPTKVGTYTAVVTFGKNEFDGYDYVFAPDFNGRFTHEVVKKEISLGWQYNTLMMDDPESAPQNTMSAFRASILNVDVFTLTAEGNTVNVDGVEYGDSPLTVTASVMGTYSITLRFNSNAARNYAFGGEPYSVQITRIFQVTSSDNSSSVVITMSGWTYLQTPNQPITKVLNFMGAEISGAVVNCTYATANDSVTKAEGSLGEIIGSTLNYSSFFPQNAGWYVVRAHYTGSADYASSVAYYVFRISKATVALPEFTTTDTVYTSERLTATADFDTQAVLVSSFDGDYSLTSTGARFNVTSRGDYKLTFELSSYDNYVFDPSIADAAGVTVTLGESGDILTVTFTWSVAKATDNTIVWDGDDIQITYGESYVVSAGATYTDSVILYYANALDSLGNQIPVGDISSWSTHSASNAGTYYVRAVCADNYNYNSAEANKKIVIVKATVTATPYGSVEYGAAFKNGTFGYDLDGFVNGDTAASVVADPSVLEYELADSSLDKNGLTVGDYDLTLKSADGYAAGLVGVNYNVVVKTGTLTVTPKAITVKLGNASSVYHDEVDLSSVSIEVLGAGIGDVSTLGITLMTTASPESVVGSDYSVYCNEEHYTNKNYVITFLPGIYTVTPLKVKVTINGGGGEFDGNITPASVSAIIPVNGAQQGENIGTTAFTLTYLYQGSANNGDRYESAIAPAKAGSYTVTVTGIANPNYELDLTSGVSAIFEITKKVINQNDIAVATKEYTGSALTPDVANTGYYTVAAHEDFVTVGTHYFTLHLTDNYDYKWNNVEGADVTMQFVITKAKNALVSSGSEQPIRIENWTFGRYDSVVNAPNAQVKFGSQNMEFRYSDSRDGVYTSQVPSDAGTYWVRVVVEGSDNFERFESEPVAFTINKAVLAAPALVVEQGVNNVYSGSELTCEVIGYNGDLMAIDYSGIKMQDGNAFVTALNAGVYTVKFAIRNGSNYRWSDGVELDESGNAVVKWTVERKKVAKPTALNKNFVVNGGVITYIPNGFDPEIMQISDNAYSYGGKFTAHITLIDTVNYEWDNGSIDPVDIPWKISGADGIFVAIVCVLGALCVIAAAIIVVQVLLNKKKKRDREEIENSATPPSGEGGNTPQAQTEGGSNV